MSPVTAETGFGRHSCVRATLNRPFPSLATLCQESRQPLPVASNALLHLPRPTTPAKLECPQSACQFAEGFHLKARSSALPLTVLKSLAEAAAPRTELLKLPERRMVLDELGIALVAVQLRNVSKVRQPRNIRQSCTDDFVLRLKLSQDTWPLSTCTGGLLTS